MNFLRQKYKEKPQAWGSFDSVQRSLFINAEKIGINPADIVLAMPLWENAGTIIHDYSHKILANIPSNCLFENNKLTSLTSSNNYEIDCGNISRLKKTNNQVTILCRYKDNGTPTAGVEAIFFRIEHPTQYATYFQISFAINAGKLRCLIQTNSINSWNALHDRVIPNINQYNTYCITWNGSTQYEYINQNFVGSVPVTGAFSSFDYYNLNTYINGCAFYNVSHPLWGVSLTGIFDYILYLDKYINNNARVEITDNPYQLWQRQPDVYFSIAASGSGGIYFLLSPFNETIVSNINISILRTIITNISNSSNTSDISVSINQLISLLLNIGNSTDCSDIVNSISRALRIDLSNSSDTSIVIQNIIRNINTSFTNQTITSGIVHSVTRLLTSLISNSSLSSDITVNMSNLVSLIMAMSNHSITSEIQASITRLLQLTILNNTNQSNIAISILRSLSATINNQTIANDINILLANLIQFGMTVSNSTALSDIITKITRDLIVNTTNTTDTSDIDYSISRTFLTNISNQTQLSEIDVQILRSLSATLTNSTVTSDTLRLIMGIIGSLINISSVVSANQYSAKVIPTNQYSANIFTNIYTGEIING